MAEKITDNGSGDLSEKEQRDLVTSTRRFDLRRILGALFVVYGVIVTVIGIVNLDADVKRTGGIAINLWTGLAMLVLGLLFFLWDRMAPVPEEDILRNREQEEREVAAGEGKETA
ncbi:MAG TPA: hypothetical protein VGC18_13185 [Lacisediminihabitans sp.]|uniref:hypothetical protein n=1 Tax=Lacisediminihabitans sp. TaxID=2787631 RepID=UPI002ED9AF4A